MVAALVAGAWWFDARTKPDAAARRIATLVTDRHAGASVAFLDANLLRVGMPSGLYIDFRLAPALQACRDDRFDCSKAIERVVADFGHAAAMVAHPRLADLRAMVRYALVAGAASTFVTPAIADRLRANRMQLKQAALANLAAESEPRAEWLSDPPGAYRVISNDDPVANLLDASRMRKLAALVGSSRIFYTVPERGRLLLARADAAGKRALASVHTHARPGEPGLFVYDTQAPGRQVRSTAEASPTVP